MELDDEAVLLLRDVAPLQVGTQVIDPSQPAALAAPQQACSKQARTRMIQPWRRRKGRKNHKKKEEEEDDDDDDETQEEDESHKKKKMMMMMMMKLKKKTRVRRRIRKESE
jgi:hypothetical protein